MKFNRFEAKMTAKMALRKAQPSPLLVTMIYVLAVNIVSGIVLGVAANPMNEAIKFLQMGYEYEEVFNYVFMGNLAGVGLYTALELVVSIFQSVAGFGYTFYCLSVSRGWQTGYTALLEGFAQTGRVLALVVLRFFIELVWNILAVIPGALVLAAGVWMESEALMGLSILAYLLGAAGLVAVLLRYRLSHYILMDDPDCSAWQALRRSKEAMRGHKWELFTLDLSFLGWLLLTPFTLGVLVIWLNPYMGVAEAKFYDHVTEKKPFSGELMV